MGFSVADKEVVSAEVVVADAAIVAIEVHVVVFHDWYK